MEREQPDQHQQHRPALTEYAPQAGQVSSKLRPPEGGGNASQADVGNIRDGQGAGQVPDESMSEPKPWPFSRDDLDYDGFIFGPFLPTSARGFPRKGANSTTREKA